MKHFGIFVAVLALACPAVVVAQEVTLECPMRAIEPDGKEGSRGVWRIRFDPRPGFAVAQVTIDRANAFIVGEYGTDWPVGDARRVRRTDEEVTFCPARFPCEEVQIDRFGNTYTVSRARLDRRSGELRMIVQRTYDGIPDAESYQGICTPVVEQPRLF